MASLAGNFRFQPSELMELDHDDLEFWLERVRDFSEAVKKSNG